VIPSPQGNDGVAGPRHDEAVTSPRLLLAAGTVAASLVGIAPAANGHAGPRAQPGPVAVRPEGVAVAIDSLRHGIEAGAVIVVPDGVTALAAERAGNPAVAARVRLTIVRETDGATIFVGSLATFRSLPVAAGDRLRVTVERDGSYRGLHASAALRWA
jgi:hypothetical protein